MTANQSNALLESSLQEGMIRNEHDTRACQEYKNDLLMATRNLQSFQNRLRVDVMVPVGNHALMPGHLYHTNEVLIGKPSGLFIESTTSQALDIVQRRIKVADKQLKDLEGEAEFFRNKLEYPQQKNVFSHEDQKEIIEEYDEEKEKQWRVAHRQKLKEAKLKEREERHKTVPDDDFQAMLENLEELELMEELQDEFNEIVIPDPVDLTGQVEFKEKPRVSYELESFYRTSEEQEKEATIENGQKDAPEVVLNKEPEDPTPDKSTKPKRKSLQFSDNLEKVKLIHKMDRPSTLITNYDPELTLQLKFKHSPVEFHPPPPSPGKSDSKTTSPTIRSPVDIYKQFAHCMKHWTAPDTPDDQPRSILKKTNHVIPVNRKARLVLGDDHQEERHFEEEVNARVASTSGGPGVNIYEQVVGDVLERNVAQVSIPAPSMMMVVEEQKRSKGNKKKKSVGFRSGEEVEEDSVSANVTISVQQGGDQQEPKRVSRFKAMRS